MNIFSSITKAFNHPVDVNIISENSSSSTSAPFHIKIELKNKPGETDLIINKIITKIERYEKDRNSQTIRDISTKVIISNDSRDVNLIIPSDKQPVYFNYDILVSFGSAIDTFNTNSESNKGLETLLSIAGNIAKVSSGMNIAKDYDYTLSVSVIEMFLYKKALIYLKANNYIFSKIKVA